VTALDGAPDGAAGTAEEDGVGGRVDDEIEALVGLEAEKEWDRSVPEDVDVGKVEGQREA